MIGENSGDAVCIKKRSPYSNHTALKLQNRSKATWVWVYDNRVTAATKSRACSKSACNDETTNAQTPTSACVKRGNITRLKLQSSVVVRWPDGNTTNDTNENKSTASTASTIDCRCPAYECYFRTRASVSINQPASERVLSVPVLVCSFACVACLFACFLASSMVSLLLWLFV